MITETRIALKNAGQINPLKINDYIQAGGYKALEKALSLKPDFVIQEVSDAGLRGRGGAGFSTGKKNQFTADACQICEQKYMVCNADEGEPGTFKDRIIMEQDPHLYLEGMIISAYAIRASKGYIYIRGEYYQSIDNTQAAINSAREHGFIGKNILNSGFDFDVEIRLGAGSYLCGEELTLIESLEGKRGYPRIKPPFPAEKGLFGLPTLVNNVETLANVPSIILNGSAWYRAIGTERSPGTKIFTVSGCVNKPGFFELPMGITLRQLIDECAGGVSGDGIFKGALLGGAAGTFVDKSFLDEKLTYDNLKEKGATLGSGAVIVFNKSASIADALVSVLRFFKHESCGKCVPCRVGTTRLYHMLKEVKYNRNDEQTNKEMLAQMVKQAGIMAATSLCPLGQSPVMPVQTAFRYFLPEFIH